MGGGGGGWGGGAINKEGGFACSEWSVEGEGEYRH